MKKTGYYRELGIFSDLAAAVKKRRPLQSFSDGMDCTTEAVRNLLNFSFTEETERDVRLLQRWEMDGLTGEELAWSTGYGPHTHAWLLKPAGTVNGLPAVLALHDHGGFKYYGKEKIADGPGGPIAGLERYRQDLYDGKAFANRLARRGFVVLVHDVFPWGSRRFPLEAMPEDVLEWAKFCSARSQENPTMDAEVDIYNTSAALHELVLEKSLAVLGTSLAGLVSFEDRLALNYLAARPEVDPQRLGCIGLSGGGCRSALLAATSERISAAVIAGMMSTYEGLLDSHVSRHTWMFFPAPLPRFFDWPQLAGEAYKGPLLVQYNREDALFSLEGMQAADRVLRSRAGEYAGRFYPGAHKFDLEMQADAFSWLEEHLKGRTQA